MNFFVIDSNLPNELNLRPYVCDAQLNIPAIISPSRIVLDTWNMIEGTCESSVKHFPAEESYFISGDNFFRMEDNNLSCSMGPELCGAKACLVEKQK